MDRQLPREKECAPTAVAMRPGLTAGSTSAVPSAEVLTVPDLGRSWAVNALPFVLGEVPWWASASRAAREVA